MTAAASKSTEPADSELPIAVTKLPNTLLATAASLEVVAAACAISTSVATWAAAICTLSALARSAGLLLVFCKTANGSNTLKSGVPEKPSAVLTAALAIFTDTLFALAYSCTKVVNGVTMVAPAGALSVMVFGIPVSILTPPTAMMEPVAPDGRKKLPLASVTTPASNSPESASPFALASR